MCTRCGSALTRLGVRSFALFTSTKAVCCGLLVRVHVWSSWHSMSRPPVHSMAFSMSCVLTLLFVPFDGIARQVLPFCLHRRPRPPRCFELFALWRHTSRAPLTSHVLTHVSFFPHAARHASRGTLAAFPATLSLYALRVGLLFRTE